MPARLQLLLAHISRLSHHPWQRHRPSFLGLSSAGPEKMDDILPERDMLPCAIKGMTGCWGKLARCS